MSEPLTWGLAWIAGGALGAFFFGGLLWTVRRGVASEHPALWFAGSLLVRTSVAVAGFYLVSGGRGGRLLFCLLGFVMAQVAVTWLARSPEETEARSIREAREVGDAP
jgi:F1F0 ATPase subunit 2